MKPKEYLVLENAVDEGVKIGITRLFKYWDKPTMTDDEMRERCDILHAAVMNSITEWFDFETSES